MPSCECVFWTRNATAVQGREGPLGVSMTAWSLSTGRKRKAQGWWQWGRAFHASKCQQRYHGRKVQGIWKTVNSEAMWGKTNAYVGRVIGHQILNDLDGHTSCFIFIPSLNSHCLGFPLPKLNILPSHHSAPILFRCLNAFQGLSLHINWYTHLLGAIHCQFSTNNLIACLYRPIKK